MAADGAPINIVVRDLQGCRVLFKIRTTTQLGRVHQVYCEKMGLDSDAVKFLYRGDRLGDSDTPADWEMEDDDIVDALPRQIGD